MQCCPLSECDETASYYNQSKRRARKPHVCEECRETITAGSTYEHISMVFDGAWCSYKLCASCVEIGNHFACGPRSVGTLWEELKDNFFPTMKAGGPCMEGLSPEAKARLFEKRLAWMTERGA